jgi:hypothetical protein
VEGQTLEEQAAAIELERAPPPAQKKP